MSRSLRRGALAATVLTLSIVTLSACGAGTSAQTGEIKPDNAATSVGDIKIQNALVITQPERDAEGPAVVSATFFNGGAQDETLESIELPAGGTVKLTPAKGQGQGGITVPAGGSVVVGGKNNASAVVPNGRESVKDGDAQSLTFRFSRTGKVELQAFVVPAKGYFKDFGPSELPQPPASGKPSQSAPPPSGSPSNEARNGADDRKAEDRTEAQGGDAPGSTTASAPAGDSGHH